MNVQNNETGLQGAFNKLDIDQYNKYAINYDITSLWSPLAAGCLTLHIHFLYSNFSF